MVSIINSTNSGNVFGLQGDSDDESSGLGLLGYSSNDESSDDDVESSVAQKIDPEQLRREDPSQDDMRYTSDLADLFIRTLERTNVGYEIHKLKPSTLRRNNANLTKSKTEHSIKIYLKDGAKEVARFDFRIQQLNNTKQKVQNLTIAYFSEIVVEEDYQGKGIAGKIIDTYARVLREKGVDIDYLHVVSENPNIARIYWNKDYRFTRQSTKQLGKVNDFLDDASKSRGFDPFIEMVRFPIGKDHLPQNMLEMESISQLSEDFISFSG